MKREELEKSLKVCQEKSLWFLDFCLSIVFGSLLYFLLFIDYLKEKFLQIDFKSLLKSVNQNTLKNPFKNRKAEQK